MHLRAQYVLSCGRTKMYLWRWFRARGLGGEGFAFLLTRYAAARTPQAGSTGVAPRRGQLASRGPFRLLAFV